MENLELNAFLVRVISSQTYRLHDQTKMSNLFIPRFHSAPKLCVAAESHGNMARKKAEYLEWREELPQSTDPSK